MNPKKLQPGLVASYNLRPGNGEGLFWFQRFINLSLTYLLRHLPTYSQFLDPHGAYSQQKEICTRLHEYVIFTRYTMVQKYASRLL